MNAYDATEVSSDGSTDDCACSSTLACYEHYLGDRGRPAIRRRVD